MERIGYVLFPILLQKAVSRKWTKRLLGRRLFRGARSDSGTRERRFGEGGVNVRTSGYVLIPVHAVLTNLETVTQAVDVTRCGIRTFGKSLVHAERGRHGIRR